MSKRSPGLSPRLQTLQTTIFAEMSQLAAATKSINLGQGFPDTDGPSEIAQAAIEAIRQGHNQYPPGIGIAPLREAVAAHQRRYYGMNLDPDSEVLITAGATEAIAAAVLALCDHGDEVILFEPFYDAYAAMVTIAGAIPKVVTLTGSEFTFEPEDLRRAVSNQTRAIILNNPHNPTGKVFTRAELDVIAEVVIAHDLVVISDDVYEHLVFEGSYLPLALLPGMWDRTLSISSAAKTFSFTGWKVGWVSGPRNLVSAVRTTKQYLTYANGAPFQVAIAYALDHSEELIPQVYGPLFAQRATLTEGLTRLGFALHPSSATYFVVSDLGPFAGVDSYQWCMDLARVAKVVAIPTSVFYLSPSGDARREVRWTYSKRDDVLHDAVDRLANAVGRFG
ncbi:MAG: aminotransferase class I/II-fold pyridoxal phosphate-dependent enzyme [Ferrimicrobium sp.]